MRERRIIYLLCVVTSLVSCSSMPTDLANFLNNLSYSKAVSYVQTAQYTLNNTSYDSTDKTTVLGSEVEYFQMSLITNDYSLQIEEDYAGSLVVADDDLGFSVVKETTTIAKGDEDYVKTVTYAGPADGDTDTTTSSLGSGDVLDLLKSYIADSDTQEDGLYYGEWLKTESRTMSSFMTVDDSDNTLDYNPGTVGTDTDVNVYYDMDITINEYGLLISYSLNLYNGDEGTYSVLTMAPTYND